MTLGLPLCFDQCQEVSDPLTVDYRSVMLIGVPRQRAEGRGHRAQVWELVFCLDLEI